MKFYEQWMNKCGLPKLVVHIQLCTMFSYGSLRVSHISLETICKIHIVSDLFDSIISTIFIYVPVKRLDILFPCAIQVLLIRSLFDLVNHAQEHNNEDKYEDVNHVFEYLMTTGMEAGVIASLYLLYLLSCFLI